MTRIAYLRKPLGCSRHGILANVVDALLTYSLKPATLLLYIDSGSNRGILRSVN